jgi:Glutaminase
MRRTAPQVLLTEPAGRPMVRRGPGREGDMKRKQDVGKPQGADDAGADDADEEGSGEEAGQAQEPSAKQARTDAGPDAGPGSGTGSASAPGFGSAGSSSQPAAGNSGESESESDGTGDEDEEPEVLSGPAIAKMNSRQLRKALRKREGGYGRETDDMPDIQFRIDALDMLGSPGWIKTPSCASLILPWLGRRPLLMPDLIASVTGRRDALASPPVPALTPAQRAEVWDAVRARTQVSPQARQDGCEYLAQAICEVIDERSPGIARLRLTKIWLVALGSRQIHPPENWNHHVAPMLECTDGRYVIDPYLDASAPITMDDWLVRARGDVPATGLFSRDRPWELIGCPRQDAEDFDPQTYIDRNQAAAQIQACRKTAT